MKDKPTEEQILNWLDGQSTPEIDAQLRADPEMLALFDSHQAMRTQFETAMPASVEPPYADFLNSRIEKEIRDLASPATKAPPQKSSSSLLSNLKWIWAPVAAAACFFLGMQIGTSPGGDNGGNGGFAAHESSLYTPDGNVSSRVMTGDSTVIVLDGLSAIPDSVDLLQASHSATSTSTFLVSTGEGNSAWITREKHESL